MAAFPSTSLLYLGALMSAFFVPMMGTGCQSVTNPVRATVEPLNATEPDAGFWHHPLPSDVRHPPGKPVGLQGVPNPLKAPQIDQITEMIRQTRRGASLLGGVAVAFSAAPATAGWPTHPAETMSEDAPFALIELDVEGAPSGRRIPLRWRFFEEGGVYHPANLLRALPDWGYALEADARYAFVIFRRAGIAPAPELAKVLAGAVPEGAWGERAESVWREALDLLDGFGIDGHALAHLQVFSTDDPAAQMATHVRQVIGKWASTMRLRDLQRTRDRPGYCLLEGSLALPQFQRGHPPYYPDGGQWVFDNRGELVAQALEEIPIAVVIPKGAMPAAGWPLMVFIHGTAGLSTQVIDRGRTEAGSSHPTAGRGPGYLLAARGIASAGAALPVNPQRVPEALGWGFYNFANPPALRDNFRQGVVEQALFLRALLSARLAPDLCPGSDATAGPDGHLIFRTDRVAAMGQSLGAIELGLWMPTEPNVAAAIPSGAGGQYGLMLPTSTIIPGELVLRLLTQVNANEIVDPLHPMMLLIQWAFDPVDPAALASRLVRRPLPTVGAKHLYMPAGYLDGFFMPESIRALVGPSGVELAGDLVHPSLETLAAQLDRTAPPYPVSANVNTPDGARTAVVVQFPEDGVLDGHHVSYQLETTKHQYTCFVATHARTGLPAVPAPVTALAACE